MNISDISETFDLLIEKLVGLSKTVYAKDVDDQRIGQALWWEGAVAFRDGGLTDFLKAFGAGVRTLAGLTLLLGKAPSQDEWKAAIASVRRLRREVDEAKKFFSDTATEILYRELITQLTLSGAFGALHTILTPDNQRIAQQTTRALLGPFLVSTAYDYALAMKVYRSDTADIAANIGVGVRDIL